MQSDTLSFQHYAKLLCALIMSLCATPIFAMEVSNIMVLSKLGEPLNAQLTISKHHPITEQELTISQASSKVYETMGVERNSLFLRLDFTINNNGIVTVSSQKPIKEPFINFILRFSWPTGELYREFTLLVDPT